MTGGWVIQRTSLMILMLLVALLVVAGTTQADQLRLSPGRREQVVFDGKSLFVSCKGRDPAGTVWLDPAQKEIIKRKGSVRVEPSRDQGDGLTGVDLVLNPVRRKDRGKYVCRASVGGLEQEASFTLVVLKPITFKENQRTQFAAEGSDFTLRCDVSGDPQPDVDWRGVTQHLQFGPNKKFDLDLETSGLIIRNVTRSDEGVYRCKATQVNSKNSDMQTTNIELRVQYKPEWVEETKREVYGYLEGITNLTCHAKAEPSPEFHWFRNGEMLLGQPEYEVINTNNKSVLKIHSVSAHMFGEFKCRAQNQIGYVEEIITLREGQKPAIPQVAVTSTGSSHITLDITSPDSEMLPEEFRAQYKIKDTQWIAAHTVQFKPGEPYILSKLQPSTEYAIRVASRNEAGYGDFSPSIAHTTAARPKSTDNPTSSSQPLVLELMLCALIMAALVVL